MDEALHWKVNIIEGTIRELYYAKSSPRLLIADLKQEQGSLARWFFSSKVDLSEFARKFPGNALSLLVALRVRDIAMMQLGWPIHNLPLIDRISMLPQDLGEPICRTDEFTLWRGRVPSSVDY